MRVVLLPASLLTLCLYGCSSDKDDTGAGDTATDSGGGDTDTDTDSDTDTDADTDTDSDTDTDPSTDVITGVTARISDKVETVVVVDWSVDGSPTNSWVEFGADTSYGSVAPERSAGASEALLLGIPQETQVHYRVGVTIDGKDHYSNDATITTGTVPSSVPDYVATDEDPGDPVGNYFMTSFFNAGTGESGVVIFNRAGDVVWYTEPTESFMPAARPALNQQQILYIQYADVLDPSDSHICRVDMDGEEDCTDTEDGHHDFWEMADGTFCYPKEEMQTVTVSGERYNLVGDDLACTDTSGRTDVLWSSFDDITPEYTTDWERLLPNGGVDWTHVNGMWYDEANDDFYFSFYTFQEIRKLHGGNTEWVFGGTMHNDFTLSGGSFGPQHAPQWDGDGIWLFDNDSNANHSRIQRWTLDESRMRAENDIDWVHPENGHAVVMGEAHELASGHVASSFGDQGDVIVWTSGGDIVFRLNPPAGVSSAQVYVYDDLYTLNND